MLIYDVVSHTGLVRRVHNRPLRRREQVLRGVASLSPALRGSIEVHTITTA